MQAMIPFSVDELEYIARLDAEADMDLLRRELPSLREEALRTLQVATILLQRCAAAGAFLSPCCSLSLSLSLSSSYVRSASCRFGCVCGGARSGSLHGRQGCGRI